MLQKCKALFEKLKTKITSPEGKRVLKSVGLFFGTIIGLCLVAVVVVTIVGVGVLSYIFSGYEPQTSTVKKENIAISENAPKEEMYHIALFGIDNLEDKVGRADTIMIFTVDKANKQLKLTSILRDSYVPVEGYGSDKINHAYAYGGAELMLHTINSNFEMNISEYVALDFKDVINIVDMVGGLDLYLSAAECDWVNASIGSLDSNAPKLPYQDGVVHLNGAQVVTFSRIRMLDNEVNRTGRQRRVIQSFATKLKEQHISDYPKLLRNVLPLVETSLTEGELLGLAVDVLGCDLNIKQYVLPDEKDDPIGGSYDGFWCWRYDIPAATENWHEFLKRKVE